MSLQTNTRIQMGKRLQQDLQLAVPQFSYALSQFSEANGASDAIITVTDPANSNAAVAVIAIAAKSFNGFNVVAELSSSAAVGLPESDCYMAVNTAEAAYSYDVAAQLTHEVFRLGAATTKMINQSSATTAAALQALIYSSGLPVDTNVTATIANDARLGAVGA